MADNHAVEDEEGDLDIVSFAAPLAAIPTATPQSLNRAGPDFTGGTGSESKAVSMASNEYRSSPSSPAEASPAKPVETSTTLDDAAKTSSSTSCAASGSDSLTCRGVSHVDIPDSPPSLSVISPAKLCSADLENDFPTVLSFKGVSVTLNNSTVWKEFYSCGTEMILTKGGRRMFPYCQYKISGLDPDRKYSLVFSIVPWGQYRYRWNVNKWEVHGPSGYTSKGLIRAYSHHHSPCLGSEWMSDLISFDKLKLSNYQQNLEGHIVLNSMHRYIPNLHVIPVPDRATAEQPVVMGTESLTFTFPQTEFVAVTCYQNFKIIQLKISHNPFAKGFREDGTNPRQQKQSKDAKLVTKTSAQAVIPDQVAKEEDGVVSLSTKKDEAPASKSNVQGVKLVLKPFMSHSGSKCGPCYSCAGGKRALCDLMLVEKQPLVEPKEEEMEFSVTPDLQQDATSSSSSPPSSPQHRKRRRKSNTGRQNSRGRHWRTAAASSSVDLSPSLGVSLQPELDDVEGLLFVSFKSKEALKVHVREMPPSAASPVAPTTPTQSDITVELEPEVDEETLTYLEIVLKNDLKALKHRQVIHPVLQEVGLKLSSVHPGKPIDLQYLGVSLPLPPPNPSHQPVSSPADEGLPFMSRNGKTNDVTKIKGWKSKYTGSKEASPTKCEGSQKNLSAFCSNMLDEYLESEALQISERAAAFSTAPESSVAYQLPEKSSSYIKTLDSALKHRNAASKLPAEKHRPSPKPQKSHLLAALDSPPSILPKTSTPRQTKPPTTSKSSSINSATPSGSGTTDSDLQKESTCSQGLTRTPVAGLGRGRGRGRGRAMSQKLSNPTKAQLRLLQMEKFALNEGLGKTQLTPERVSAALSAVLTKEMFHCQVLNTSQFALDKSFSPECGRDYCRLGCVCSSLQQENRKHLHCRRPECMFGCTCLKHKLTKQTTQGESEEQDLPLYSVTNMQHAAQPCPDSLASKLWSGSANDEDPEPLFTPEHPNFSVFSPNEPDPKPMFQEEDEDILDVGLESSMMCARVRGISSQPRPQVVSEPNSVSTPASNTATHLQDTTDNLGKNENDTVPPSKKAAEKTSPESLFNDKEAKKQIQIHSKCRWEKDRGWVTKLLCDHIQKKRFSKRFYIGPYCISPVAKIFMRKSSGTTITYKVQISKKFQRSDTEEDDSDYSNEELEEGQVDQSPTLLGVTPFLRGVIPAGRLTARPKPAGHPAQGLVQVNGKFYNHAKVMLGNIGSLHPANRLAAYVCGRLPAPKKLLEVFSQKPDPPQKPNDSESLSIKVAGSVVPRLITARKATNLKTPVQMLETDLCRKESNNSPQSSDCSSTANSAQSLVSSHSRLFESLDSRTPVSLTVSPSLKNPSFLDQRGTRSFRICPPSSQSQNLDGVSLPGGFYLIQLPKSEADKAAQQTQPSNGASKATTSDKKLENNGAMSQLAADWFGTNAFDKIRSLFGNSAANPDSLPDPNCIEKMPSGQNDESKNYQTIKEESNLDDVSEYASSGFSDYSGDCDEDDDDDDDDEYVEVETMEESEEKEIIQWKETAFEKLQLTRKSSKGFTSRKLNGEDGDEDGSMNNRRRYIHTTLERQRRVQQRTLFHNLELILQIDPPNSRLKILTEAQKEINNLVQTAKLLEKKKRMLIESQSAYLKKLCSLSGKSEKEIRKKLIEICKKLKMKEDQLKLRPDVWEHLKLRAALLQATAAQSSRQPSPLVEHGYATPSQDELLTIPAHSNIQKILSVLQPPQDKPLTGSFVNASHPKLPALLLAGSVAPSLRGTTKPEDAVDSLQARQCLSELVEKGKKTGTSDLVKALNSQTESHRTTVKAASEDSAVQDGDQPASSTPSPDASKDLPKPISLPLIRSKTGRIILPSCLKPLGDGFYTLTLLKPKKDVDGGDASSPANAQLSPVDTSTTTEKNDSETNQPSPTESGCDLEGKTESSHVDSEVQEFPTADSNLPNHSVCGPSTKPKVQGKSQEGGAEAGVKKTLAALRLAFNGKIWPPASADSKGRPFQLRQERPVSLAAKPAHEDGKDLVEKETNKASDSTAAPELVEKEQEKTVMTTEEKGENKPLRAKRRGGRPKSDKGKQALGRQGPGKRPGGWPSKSDKDNSISYPRRLTDSQSMAMRVQRPQTRGSLGKDFPSAKKRSWIDVERELEPEFDYE